MDAIILLLQQIYFKIKFNPQLNFHRHRENNNLVALTLKDTRHLVS